ncbi:hypothetical protein BFJ69_g16509 [Fusarium oxysporum]|uniref:Uncharacterized protein n=1 Tax=Fusarium oxysporum TaxID=5507 RepID=A0A420MB23_FUSOX|nr:hypothetical protein BFJ69_g16509 [Fusarium oxysporum]
MGDMRPVWVDFWGSGNTLAQAIWDVRRTRTVAQLDEFLAKIHVYADTDQDSGNDGEGYVDSAQFWMRKTFKLFYIWAESACLTPSQARFGGRFIYGTGPDNQTQAFVDDSGVAANQGSVAINNSLVDQTNDFIAMIDWATNGIGNRHPKLAIASSNGYNTLVVEAAPSEMMGILSAVGSSDTDGNMIKYSWTQDSGVGYTNTEGSESEVVVVQVPAAAAGENSHIFLRGVDDGSPPLASYRRIILRVALKYVGPS